MQHPSKWLVMAALVASTLLGMAACSGDAVVPERPFDCAGEVCNAVVPERPFDCGEEVCDANTEYCLHVQVNGPEEDEDYSYCRPYPAWCVQTPTCECIQDPYSDCLCSDDKGEVEACFYSPG